MHPLFLFSATAKIPAPCVRVKRSPAAKAVSIGEIDFCGGLCNNKYDNFIYGSGVPPRAQAQGGPTGKPVGIRHNSHYCVWHKQRHDAIERMLEKASLWECAAYVRARPAISQETCPVPDR